MRTGKKGAAAVHSATSIRMTDHQPRAFACGWIVKRGEDTFIHVMPKGDVVAHVARFDCPCGPMVDTIGKRVFVHNSADCREHFEQLKPM